MKQLNLNVNDLPLTNKCGTGSTIENTRVCRRFLSKILKKYQVKSIIDLGCGNFNWMRFIKLKKIDYRGYDWVPEFINQNKRIFPGFYFEVTNILEMNIPKVDLILIKEVFIHLENGDILNLIKKFKMSNSRFFLSESFPGKVNSLDFRKGNVENWRKSRYVNLQSEPFNLPRPVEFVKDYSNRILAMWDLKEVNIV